MSKEEVFNLISDTLKEVVPELEDKEIQPGDNFKELGVNSIERMETTMLLLEEIELDIPRTELLQAKTLGDMAAILEEKMKVVG